MAENGNPAHMVNVKSGPKCSTDCCYIKMKDALGKVFMKYGCLVGNHPIYFIVFPILILGGLGAGLATLDEEKDLEKVYFPMDSQAIKDRQIVRDTFPDLNNVSYNSFSQSDVQQAVTLIFRSKGGKTIFSDVLDEVRNIVDEVKALTAVRTEGSQAVVVTFREVCAKFKSQCVVDGEYVLTSSFRAAVSAGSVTYPYWNNAGKTIDLRFSISGVETLQGSVLNSATVFKISFKLAKASPTWQKLFETYAEDLNPVLTDVFYESPDSLSVEVDKSTDADFVFFALTIALCCTYACLVAAGGNPVSTRGLLAFTGILAAGLGILGSMGLLCACGVKFLNIVDVVPFLVIGIGIDHMFLLMSSWSETLGNHMAVPDRVGASLASAGIGITITSLTDFLAFVIGTTSVFRSVTNVFLYAGVAVLFSYLANITLFAGCLSLHGRRVFSSRHTLTCEKIQPREALWAESRSACGAICCGGEPPTKTRGDESCCEKFPSLILPKLFTKKLFCVFTILAFVGYLAAAIYGAFHLRQGVVFKDLVLESSYYHSFLTVNDQHFPTTLPVGFIIERKMDYSAEERTKYLIMLGEVRKDPRIMSGFERCWLSSYLNSSFYGSSTTQNFVSNLRNFLTNAPEFQADVVLDGSKTKIIASRCFVMTEPNSDQYALAELMEDLREIADDSSLPVIVYHSAFVAYEQFLAVLPATLMMVGCAVAVMAVVTFLFLPHLLMVCLVVLNILMILTGVFGFLYFWDLSLSFVTMIQLVMSVGFSVDYSVQVCAAYLMSEQARRRDRVTDAVRHASGPILNGAASALIGVVVLLASSSYVFFSFFRIMVLVIGFGMLHAVLFVPAVLSLVGPENAVPPFAERTVRTTRARRESSEQENAPNIEPFYPVVLSLVKAKDRSVLETVTPTSTIRAPSRRENVDNIRPFLPVVLSVQWPNDRINPPPVTPASTLRSFSKRHKGTHNLGFSSSTPIPATRAGPKKQNVKRIFPHPTMTSAIRYFPQKQNTHSKTHDVRKVRHHKRRPPSPEPDYDPFAYVHHEIYARIMNGGDGLLRLLFVEEFEKRCGQVVTKPRPGPKVTPQIVDCILNANDKSAFSFPNVPRQIVEHIMDGEDKILKIMFVREFARRYD